MSTETPIAGGSSSSRPAGNLAPASGGQPDGGVSPASPSGEIVSIHVTAAVAVILAALASHERTSVGGIVAKLTVEAAEAAGLAVLAKGAKHD